MKAIALLYIIHLHPIPAIMKATRRKHRATVEVHVSIEVIKEAKRVKYHHFYFCFSFLILYIWKIYYFCA